MEEVLELNSNHSLSLDLPIRLPNPSFPPVFFHPIACYALTGLLSVIVFLPPERSFLAYAFPLLDMCSLRLGSPTCIYLLFPSLLCPPMCSYSFRL